MKNIFAAVVALVTVISFGSVAQASEQQVVTQAEFVEIVEQYDIAKEYDIAVRRAMSNHKDGRQVKYEKNGVELLSNFFVTGTFKPGFRDKRNKGFRVDTLKTPKGTFVVRAKFKRNGSWGAWKQVK